MNKQQPENNGSLVSRLEDEYGAYFEQMTYAERFYLLRRITEKLWDESGYPDIPNIETIVRSQKLPMSRDESLSLMEFLLAQIRSIKR